jgi:LAO/AO transport system kinase
VSDESREGRHLIATVDVKALVSAAGERQVRALAKLISQIEDGSAQLPEIMRSLKPRGATIVGLTGSPGVGKSTLTSALISAYRAQGLSIGILAIDPSSPFTQGAVLGDRIRMQDHFLDDHVFIRSMATRGHLGGLAAATPQAIRLLDHAGFDVILVETVGVGQSEVEIVSHADTTLVVLAPGMGDSIQAVKAGLLEIGDIYVINKADRDGAEVTSRELRHALALVPQEPEREIILTSADRGTGVTELTAAIDRHHQYLQQSGALLQRQVQRASLEIEHLTAAALRQKIRAGRLTELANEVAAGKMDAYSAADELLKGI